jgi:hypothetical protein
MIRLPISKVLATASIAILIAIFVLHDYARWAQRGRDAFLTYQAGRFDRYIAAPSMTTTFLAALLGAAIIVIGYELLAKAFSKVLPSGKA